jgi:hypothetical protein
VSSCGLRVRGVPIGEMSTMLAAYDASQHLLAWRREPAPAWQLPAEPPPAIVDARCRRELDGELVDSSPLGERLPESSTRSSRRAWRAC